ncbi:MAG: hypothetical protein P8Y63_01170 [Deltaproteobacteria bacterium]|jgi:hypothetical protein
MRRMPVGLLRRIEALEKARNPNRYADFPPIMGLDEWEALAVASQAELVFLTQEHLEQPEAVAEPVVNTQAEHHRYNREEDRQRKESPRDYLKHKEEQVRRTTVMK